MTRKKDLLVEEPTDEMLSSIEANLEQELSGEATSEDNSDEINYPKTGETYNHKDKLTLDIDGQPVTRKLNDWIRMDPVALHKAILSIDFLISRDNFRILMSGLRANHIDYYRKSVGLDILIDFPGQPQPLAAKGLYNYEPVKFYKWWAANEKQVYMTTREKIQLFIKVESIKKGTLLKRHQEFLNNLRSPKA
ncbi:MAG: hypothetical protein MJZ57_08440 [Bacteroidales bacterium]|nr:hypothetical protein [Bacteroidales bacterium]